MLLKLNNIKKNVLFIVFSLSYTIVTAQPFITTWKTNNTGSSSSTSITIPTTGAGYNYDVDWNDDGVFDEFGLTGNVTHDFGAAGTYTIRIQGAFPRIYFNNTGDRLKILSIDQWGSIAWSNMSRAFKGCTNLTYAASDSPDLSSVTDMTEMFRGCTNFNGNIGSWDMSNITNINYMFYQASSFNGNISGWNTSNIQSMDFTFSSATSFNQNIGGWNTSSLMSLYGTFNGASSFNQDISSWNTSIVNNMAGTFSYATSFNQNINAWNVGNVTDMSGMFNFATSFNQNISGWNTSNVNDMSSMFAGASSFNQNIGTWDVSGVSDMFQMFVNATSFNGNISGWNTSGVFNMRSMFNNASSFNQNIGGWNVSNVFNMQNMFTSASSFNQNIGGWNVGNVSDMRQMFSGASSFNQDISSWDISNVSLAIQMFQSASSFNQDISSWDVSGITNMYYMFAVASSFSQNLGSWDITNVTSMTHMLSNSGMSRAMYDSTLIGWEAQSVQNNVPLGATGLKYCVAEPERTLLISDHSWTITGDALNCVPALPIDLIHFSAFLGDYEVEINWETATEINNDYFVLERSLDTDQWEEIVIIEGKGNSNSAIKYHWKDKTAYKQVNYYRLKQVDFDGSYSYSSIISVDASTIERTSNIEVYPNPSSKVLNVNTGNTKPKSIEIYSLSGEKMEIFPFHIEHNTYQFDISELSKGIYSIHTGGENNYFIKY